MNQATTIARSNVLRQREYSEKAKKAVARKPQLFIDGQLVGGCDIVTELHVSGQLKEMVDAAA